jgi:hypothetical protein
MTWSITHLSMRHVNKDAAAKRSVSLVGSSRLTKVRFSNCISEIQRELIEGTT